MKLFYRILTFWLTIVGLVGLAFLALDHWDVPVPVLISNLILVLLGIVSIYIFANEPTRKTKPLFLNFSIYFLSALAYFVYPFFGKVIFPGDLYPGLYFYQYVLCGWVVFSLSFSLLYVVFDSLFNDWEIWKKYVFTLVVVGGVFTYYYQPFFHDAKYLYKTEDVQDWVAVEKANSQLIEQGVEQPTASDIASVVTLSAWKDGKAVGHLFDEENVQRISAMLPYLEGDNFSLLIYKKLYLNVIFMDVLSIVFIFVFFGFQYKKDPPQGAYIEKILFIFLPYCSLEVLHFYAYVTLVDYSTYLALFEIAQYLVIFNLLLLLIFFSLRLSFITSIKGEFYERELVLDSEHISRWRDGIDNLVVRHFLNPKTFHGRLFTPREAKSRT